MSGGTENGDGCRSSIESYYRLHAWIYDATRWSFLFNRAGLVRLLGQSVAAPARILEVGCGTGKNLVLLNQRFPTAHITGLDLSEAMLEKARRKTLSLTAGSSALVRSCYDAPVSEGAPFDLVLFSYALSMFNPGWKAALAAAFQDLRAGGVMAVVDFHDTAFPLFRRWMGVNHVRMDAHLLGRLEEMYEPCIRRIHRAYGGLWRYFMFAGTKG